MIYITPNLDKAYLSNEEKFNLSRLMNEKSFTKAHTPLSYRQINTLSKDKLFPEERDTTKGWRKFSLKELVFFYIVFELKKYGLPHEILKNLSKSFFEEPTAEVAIGYVLTYIEIVLTIKSDGTVDYYDPSHYLLIGIEKTPAIQIHLNSMVNVVREKVGQPLFGIKVSTRNYLWNHQEMSISENEKEIIKMIRNKEFTSIAINKKDGGSLIVHAGRANNNDINAKDIIKMLQEKDFQDISIIQRNGKIVHYDIKETYKLALQ